MAKQHTYKVKGMHCASCEILIEKKLLEINGVKSIDASTSSGEVTINYDGELPNIHKLNNIFKEFGYTFLEEENKKVEKGESKGFNKTFLAFDIALVLIVGFLLLDKAGIGGLLNVGSGSSLATFFGFGLLAGISSCAALVGGIVLSMSKQWSEVYSENNKFSQKIKPHLMFNIGRVLSYAFFGAILGVVGSRLQISLGFTSFLIIVISFIMIALGLQMLGVKAFRKFQFTLPKSITRNIANEKNFQGKYMPFVMGALTFFLPCGFTITAQGLALLSGSWVQGALIMTAFALGTVPMLLFIGISSVKFSAKPEMFMQFTKVAGFLVIFFALFNLNNQLNVLGYGGFSGIFLSQNSFSSSGQILVNDKDLAPIVNGKQIIKMTASGLKDSPNYFKVRAGVPVSWEITGENSLGCNGAIVARNLFSDVVTLTPGGTVTKEFTPTTVGKFGFSCTMGMVRGTIEVVNIDGAKTDNNLGVQTVSAATVQPKTGGCGCGGGGNNSCGGNNVKIKNDAVATPAIVQNNSQIISASYTASNYLSPNSFKVKAGVPVKLSINVKDDGTGCGNAIKIPGLYNNVQVLSAGSVINMEFTPQNAGNYNITCAMGMIKFGLITVE